MFRPSKPFALAVACACALCGFPSPLVARTLRARPGAAQGAAPAGLALTVGAPFSARITSLSLPGLRPQPVPSSAPAPFRPQAAVPRAPGLAEPALAPSRLPAALPGRPGREQPPRRAAAPSGGRDVRRALRSLDGALRSPSGRAADSGPLLRSAFDGGRPLAAGPAAPADVAPSAVDDTGVLARLIERARDGAPQPVPAAARGMRFLLVPGLGWALGDGQYFRPMLERFRALGLDVEFVATEPLGTAAENAGMVAAAVARSEKPVVLIGHSKGGVDLARALEDFPEVQRKTRKAVAIQSPYFGTPWADWFAPRLWLMDALVAAARLLRPGALRAFRVFGRRETARELTRRRRGRLSRERLAVREPVELFSVASQVKRFTIADTLEWLKVDLLRILPKRGSDGVVAVADAVLPGSRYAVLDEVSHWEPVMSPMEGVGSLFDTRRRWRHFVDDFTDGLLRWLFAREAPAEAPPPAAGREAARRDYLEFLGRLGFEPSVARFDEALAQEGLTESRRGVLLEGRSRARPADAAVELAAGIMGGLAERGWAEDALRGAADLAAELLALRPLAPPEALPAALRREPEHEVLSWLAGRTAERIGRQLGPLARAAARLGAAGAEGPLRDILVAMYSDPEIGGNRLAGRALAASLLRHARRHGRPELEEALERAVLRRGLRLSDFVGDRVELRDRRGADRRLSLKDGDILGIRRRSRDASEITAGARPPRALSGKAARERLLGPVPAIWIDPEEAAPRQVAGQPARNLLRRLWHGLRRWLGSRSVFLRGYSHVGMVSLKEADGVALAWVLHTSVDSGNGGIRKEGVIGEFVKPGSDVRLGFARLDAEATRRDFLRQAREAGFSETPARADDGAWASGIGREGYEALRLLAETDAEAFLKELNRRALEQVGRLLLSGTAYDFGWLNRLWAAHCSSLMVLAYKLGAQFELQWRPDRWHGAALLLKRLGWANARDLRTDLRIVWPGSLFVDPKVGRHEYMELPVQAPSPEWADSARWDEDASPAGRKDVLEALRRHLPARRDKITGASGWRSGVNPATGYFAALERLFLEAR